MQTIANASKIAPGVKKFEFDLESLRGFAALLVVVWHAVAISNCLDPHYTPSGILGALVDCQIPAHFCVLIFFVLSGYVIGLSTKGYLQLTTAGPYLKKRLVRIYPIYLISILAALAVSVPVYPWRTILGNLVFLQIIFSPIIVENGPSWSLHYEVLYYLLFIPFSLSRISPVLVIGSCLAVGLLTMQYFSSSPLPASYAFGFAFWCCGWAISRYVVQANRVERSYTLLLSTLLLFFSLGRFNYLDALLGQLFHFGFGHDLAFPVGLDIYKTMLSAHDFAYLPYAMVGVLVFTHNRFRFRQVVLSVLFLLPSFTFFHLVRYHATIYKTPWLLPTLSYCLALVLFFKPSKRVDVISQKLMLLLTKIGGISYGLYIIHFPILFAFQKVNTFSGSGLTYWIRFTLFILLSLLAAYLLEKKFQMWMRKILE